MSNSKTGGIVSLTETLVFEGTGDINCKKEIKDMVKIALSWVKSNKQQFLQIS